MASLYFAASPQCMYVGFVVIFSVLCLVFLGFKSLFSPEPISQPFPLWIVCLPASPASSETPIQDTLRGAGVVPLVESLSLGFSLGRDIGVVGLSPATGSVLSAESA